MFLNKVGQQMKLYARNEVVESLERGDNVAVQLCDFPKAYDCVTQTVLIDEME